jgi:hypothetical protein
MRNPQHEDMFSGLHPKADITGSSGVKIASAGNWCDGGDVGIFGAGSPIHGTYLG